MKAEQLKSEIRDVAAEYKRQCGFLGLFRTNAERTPTPGNKLIAKRQEESTEVVRRRLERLYNQLHNLEVGGRA